MKHLLLRLLGVSAPVYVNDPQTLHQIAEDVHYSIREIEAEYGVRLVFGRHQDRVLTLSALQK